MPNDPILHLLGLARKAGRLEIGEEPVGALCRSHHARLVLLADNSAPNTYRRAAHFGESGNVLHIALPYTKEELGFCFGRSSVAILALSDAGMAASLVEKLAAMYPERYSPAALQLRQKADKMLQRQQEKRQHEKNLRTGKVRRSSPPQPKAQEQEPAPAPKKKTPSDPRSTAQKPPKRPGYSASRSRNEGERPGDRRTAPSFKPGPGGRKLTAKFRKP